jgi:hypothetical protein
MNVLDFVALRLSRKVKHCFQKIWVLTIYGLVAQCPATANVDGVVRDYEHGDFSEICVGIQDVEIRQDFVPSLHPE